MTGPSSLEYEAKISDDSSSDIDEQYYEDSDDIYDSDLLYRDIRELTEPEWNSEERWAKFKAPRYVALSSNPSVDSETEEESTSEQRRAKGACLFKLDRSNRQSAQRYMGLK